MPSLKPNVRNKINKAIGDLITPSNKTRYFDVIPLFPISCILDDYGIILLQEDNTKWSGFLVGDNSYTTFNLAPIESENEDTYTPYKNVMLCLQWYKMNSGRYETNCYLS